MNVSFVQFNAVFDMISRRIENNFEPSPLTVGALAKIPDWSCPETGLPGAASAKQILERKNKNLKVIKCSRLVETSVAWSEIQCGTYCMSQEGTNYL